MTLARSRTTVDESQETLLPAWGWRPERAVGASALPVVQIGDRTLRTTEVFDTYWRFAAAVGGSQRR